MISYKVKNRFEPSELGKVRISGSISDQMETFFSKRVTSDYARDVILAECEEQFSLRNDDETVVGWWRGEFWGKFVISACRVARYEHDEKLKKTLLESALKLISTADEDGYIGTYRDKTNFFAADREKTKAIMGWSCNWNWNLWCRKYTLWGMLEIHELTEDRRILDAAAKFADQYISMLEEMNVRPGATGTFNGLPTCSIMKPMLILYRITENERYLNFSLKIADDWERDDGHIPNLISNALSMRPVHEWYPASQNWAKAYEMMSCLDGLLELYRVTGVGKYLRAVENMYKLLKKYEGNSVLSVGFNDIFANAAEYQNSISEPCDVIHWMRICSGLYELTGDPKYADTFEEAYYNPFLASGFRDGTWGARGVRSSGRHMVAQGQAHMKHSHCCVNNMPRGFLNGVDFAVTSMDDGLSVNLYSPISGEIGGFEFEISGDYFGKGKVFVKITTKTPAHVRLRLPVWSKETIVNGTSFMVPGSYTEQKIIPGENIFELTFDMTPRIVDFNGSVERFPNGDFRFARIVGTNDGNGITENELYFEHRARIFRGPLLLCRSKLVGNSGSEMFGKETIFGKRVSVAAEPIESHEVRAAFHVKVSGDLNFETKMCDYASGSNIYSENDPGLFSIWM